MDKSKLVKRIGNYFYDTSGWSKTKSLDRLRNEQREIQV